jgi:hypothetical protein
MNGTCTKNKDRKTLKMLVQCQVQRRRCVGKLTATVGYMQVQVSRLPRVLSVAYGTDHQETQRYCRAHLDKL